MTHTHRERGYGFFCGGDPRNFHPDGESSTDAEIARPRSSARTNKAGRHIPAALTIEQGSSLRIR